jgi:6-pyruvoyl-tetrahydropterin synthase
MTTLFVDQLTVIDSAYLCPINGLVGESWIVDITLTGALNDESMVMDFGLVKKALKRAIDDSIDHTLIVPIQAPQLQLEHTGNTAQLRWAFGNGETLEYSAPTCAITLLESATVSNEAITQWLHTLLARHVPANVGTIGISLRHETHADAYYHYTHGLRKHAGNCQRMAHGHRSRIEIWRDGTRDATLEHELATHWRYAHLGCSADVTRHDHHVQLAYQAPQGQFALTLPAMRCHILPGDSTVESIAEYVASTMRARFPHSTLTVRAFEGVQKGAVA